MDNQALVAIAIFLMSYALISTEKIHRTVVAMAGGILIIIFGVVDQETALHHIDFNTLGLLIGMMIIVNITSETGLFTYIAIWSAKKAKGDPLRILIYLACITAFASAFLDNVTTVLLMVPIVFSITRQLRISPLPYLILVVLSSNIGGTMTMIGDPPNIMIGSAVKELSFLDFMNNLALICVFILIVTITVFVMIYRKKLQTTQELKAGIMQFDEKSEIKDIALLKKCLAILMITIVGFFIHQIVHLESATVALAGAFLLLLITDEHQLERALSRVEWLTIFFFIGLFVIVSGLVETGVIGNLAKYAIQLTGGNEIKTAMLILWLSAIASAFVDNIPFVATMIPLIQDMGNLGVTQLDTLWWSLALGACLGGNGTLIGASANLIVAGMAAKEGQPISFIAFLKIGFPLMILSIIISSIYIYLRYLLWN